MEVAQGEHLHAARPGEHLPDSRRTAVRLVMLSDDGGGPAPPPDEER
ncbi:hypothetical protein ACFVH0_05875 [Streptomyces sp. NPDC127117]